MAIPSAELARMPNLKEFKWNNHNSINEFSHLIDLGINLKLKKLDITIEKVLFSATTDNHWICQNFSYATRKQKGFYAKTVTNHLILSLQTILALKERNQEVKVRLKLKPHQFEKPWFTFNSSFLMYPGEIN